MELFCEQSGTFSLLHMSVRIQSWQIANFTLICVKFTLIGLNVSQNCTSMAVIGLRCIYVLRPNTVYVISAITWSAITRGH